MKTIEYTTIDRSELDWPSGPWDGEPDKVQWPDEATGLPCLAVRHQSSGHWCGYVGVGSDHRYYGINYDDCQVEVHGGLTFASHCQPGGFESSGVCHLPEPGESGEVWWLGFDCAHAWDLSPWYQARGLNCPLDVYRTLDYVKDECKSLAAQLAKAA
jgi:hypothetical protein